MREVPRLVRRVRPRGVHAQLVQLLLVYLIPERLLVRMKEVTEGMVCAALPILPWRRPTARRMQADADGVQLLVVVASGLWRQLRAVVMMQRTHGAIDHALCAIELSLAWDERGAICPKWLVMLVEAFRSICDGSPAVDRFFRTRCLYGPAIICVLTAAVLEFLIERIDALVCSLNSSQQIVNPRWWSLFAGSAMGTITTQLCSRRHEAEALEQ